MSTREITCYTLHCNVTDCGNTLDDYESELPIHFETFEKAAEYARNEDWITTKDAVSYGPYIIERFAVCPEGGKDHYDARKLIAGKEQQR